MAYCSASWFAKTTQHSQTIDERRVHQSSGHSAINDVRALQLIPLIAEAGSTGEVINQFREVLQGLGADAGVFLSCLRDDATRTPLRSLSACDPSWVADYASQRRSEHDPWLLYASTDAEPIRSSYLACSSTEDNAFIRAARSKASPLPWLPLPPAPLAYPG